MRAVVLLFSFLLSSLGFTGSIRISEFRVPDHVVDGTEALLSCHFDMEGDVLESVKWYKDGHEFYRYSVKSSPALKRFPIPGIIIDEARSSTNHVALVGLTRKSEGMYRCQVSGDSPRFQLVFEEKHMSVDRELKPTND